MARLPDTDAVDTSKAYIGGGTSRPQTAIGEETQPGQKASPCPFLTGMSVGNSNQGGQTGKLAEALAKAQAEFKTVPKSKTAKGEKFSYKYADLNDVLGMAVPILARHGIAFMQPIRRDGDKTYVVTRIQLGSEFMEDAGLPIPLQVRPQELGTYLTYYKRYSVSSFLGISADEDTGAVETRPDFKSDAKPSASESHDMMADKIFPPKPEVKRGRPANKPNEVIRTSVSPNAGPQEETNVHGVAITDKDLPEFDDKPTPAERKEYQTRLKSFIALTSVDRVKAFVNSAVGGQSTTNLTKSQWDNVLSKLDAAKAENKLEELLK